MDIVIRTIPHGAQRYDTSGDWYFEGKTLQIRVSARKGPDSEFLIALHELVESWLCLRRGITQEAVDRFDMGWDDAGEPGEDPDAPYRSEHRFAEKLERTAARELGVDWEEHVKDERQRT